MRGILINPETQEISEIEYDGDYRSIYKLLDIRLFTLIHLSDNESLFLDDEGLLKDPEFFFGLVGPNFKYHQPLAGKGLILGTDEKGESIGSNLSLETVKENVRFARLEIAGWTEPKTIEDADTPFGKGFAIIGSQPIYKKKEA